MDYEKIFAEAIAAANEAQDRALAPYGGKEPQFACGFVWVKVTPATDPFVKWCKKQISDHGLKHDSVGNITDTLNDPESKSIRYRLARAFGSPGTYGSWEFWAPGNFRGQWINCKEAGAEAFANVLKNYGIQAVWSSRLD